MFLTNREYNDHKRIVGLTQVVYNAKPMDDLIFTCMHCDSEEDKSIYRSVSTNSASTLHQIYTGDALLFVSR
jgi:hypothetical protein